MSNREYQVAGLRDSLACYPPVGDCVIINCANCRISELEAKVAAMEWTEVESGGMPDEEGWYLCAFSDGSVETFNIDEQMIADGGWKGAWAKITLTHWTANPAHPRGE